MVDTRIENRFQNLEKKVEVQGLPSRIPMTMSGSVSILNNIKF